MNRLLFLLSIIIFVKCGSADNSKQETVKQDEGKEPSNAIIKPAPFIYLQLKVQPFSVDSIMVKTVITNNWNNELAIYKPLLPFDSAKLELFSIMEKRSYDRLDFAGQPDQENYLNYEDGPTDLIVPNLDTANFIFLQPGKTLEIKSNIAHKYDFKKYLKKRLHEFKLVYYREWPYVVDGKQVTEMDSTDNQVKPVYFVASLPENDDPDSMRVDFRIP